MTPEKLTALGRIVAALPEFDSDSLVTLAEYLEAQLRRNDGPALRLSLCAMRQNPKNPKKIGVSSHDRPDSGGEA